MARRKDDKPLRRLVANLARARAEDVDAVLDELSPDHRLVVRDLLDAYRGQAPARIELAQPKPPGDVIDLQGFSPAIAQRLAPKSAGSPEAWCMTEATASALRACARQTPPAPASAPVAHKGRSRLLGGAR